MLGILGFVAVVWTIYFELFLWPRCIAWWEYLFFGISWMMHSELVIQWKRHMVSDKSLAECQYREQHLDFRIHGCLLMSIDLSIQLISAENICHIYWFHGLKECWSFTACFVTEECNTGLKVMPLIQTYFFIQQKNSRTILCRRVAYMQT